ncbi:Uncharacterized protein FWK35_00018874 [Aphis craccivora]|uniref:Uncharacterized protein n=1 Tax=Aphis craccivora TaxID=307492 RepID=A0A6G0ZRA1_APHCR|nr:Uncharacterized protein FWK35_00018874 [Aphis craccivora]
MSSYSYTVIRPPIDARAFVSPPLKTAIITGHLMFLLSPMAFYDLNTIHLYIYIYIYIYVIIFFLSCDVVVSACHLPLDFGSKIRLLLLGDVLSATSRFPLC